MNSSWQDKYFDMFDDYIPEPEGYYDLPTVMSKLEHLAKKAVQSKRPYSQKDINKAFGHNENTRTKDTVY